MTGGVLEDGCSIFAVTYRFASQSISWNLRRPVSNSGDTCYINTFDRVPWSILKIPDMSSSVHTFRKCGTYRARLKPGENSWDYRLKASIELQRNLLRVISRLAGFCLIWPGAWAIIGISNTFYPDALAWPYLTGLRCGLRL
jgi:hypothetical protein